jgi:hypothetical protein
MSLSYLRRGAVVLAAVIVVFLLLAQKYAQAADITVILDQATLVKLPDRVATLVIGNPVIADANVQAGGWMVITGKGYGSTNIVALDRGGVVLMEKSIEVQGLRSGIVVVYKGVDRETYSCTPNCERRLALGDGQTYFEQTAGQITARSALAAGAAQPPR